MPTVYIAPTAQGLADGTSAANAYAIGSLATAESDAQSGGKILFMDGTYSVTATLQLGASNVTYEAVNLRKAVFDFSNGGYGLELGRTADSFAGFAMKGLVFDNLGGAGFNGAVDIEIANDQLLTVDDCDFLDMTSTYKAIIGSGSPTNTGAMNVTFTGCVLTGSTSSDDVDFFRYRLSSPSHNITLNNCTCIFTNNATNEFFITTTNGSVTVKNSILAQDGSGTTTLGTATIFTESNNCYFGIGESADPAKSIIVDDPQFVDSINGDYRLRPSSPCIISGVSKETKYPNAIWFDSNSNPIFQTYNFSLDSGDGSNYTFSGDATGSDPVISAETGDVLIFINNTGGHPLEIQDSDGNSIATESGGSLTFSTLRPGEYTYICQAHPSMSNTITITANVGLSKNPTNSFKSAVDAIYSNDNVIIFKNGSHNLIQSETGGNGAGSTFSFSAGSTATKLTIIGESIDGTILVASGSGWGAAFNLKGTSIALKLQTLTLRNDQNSHLGVIAGGANTTVEIDNCSLTLGGSVTTNNLGWFTGDTNPDSTLTITNSFVACGAVGGSSPKGALAGGGSEDNYNVFDLQNNTFVITVGTSPYLIDPNVGNDLSSFTFKNNIFIGLSGSETIGINPTTASHNCYHNLGVNSDNAPDSAGAVFGDPQFIDSANGDYRLRPSSPCVGDSQNFKNTSNVYYLQPDNPFNGDGSQKDASSMTADGDAGPFNAFKNIVAAGVPYGSTIIILNGTYSWPLEFSTTRSSDITTTNWESYAFAGYNYVAETSNEVIFDAQGANKTFVYKPYGGTPGSGVYLDLDTSFTGIQLNNPVGSGDNTTGTRISTQSSSAGLGSCTFNNCKFLGWINTSIYSWTGGGRNKYGSTMHWKGCSISVAFDTPTSLFGGGDGYADDEFHGAWSWENCTFYIPVGLTTFSGRNAANGTYVSPNKLFGNTGSQSLRLFKNNVLYIPDGSCPLGISSANAHYLPQIENNCFLGVDVSAHLDLFLEKNNLIDVDPEFVDPSNNNFSLRPTSSLIGKGQ